jgi:hypothetical protein
MTHDNYLSKCPSVGSENLDMWHHTLYLWLLCMQFFFAVEHLYGVLVTSN